MTDNGDRFVEGALIVLVMTLIALVVWFVYEAVVYHTEAVGLTIAAAFAFVVVSWAVGYAVNDLGDDVARWRGGGE